MDIMKLIRPQSVAVVGASQRPSAVGFRVARACLQSANHERVYLVNPKGGVLFDRPCFPSLDQLPEVVDSVVLCTPKEQCAPILRQAGSLGVRAAVVYASGFSEEGSEEGRRLERELLDVCAEYDIAMLGPNCAGFTNNIDKIFHTMPGLVLANRPTGIGILSQSGFVASSLTKPEYMRISYGFSTGNGNCVCLEDCMEFLVEDPDTDVLAIYLEGVRNGSKFTRLLSRAHEKGKPIVMLKTGVSAHGAKATASHTGSISGSHQIYESFFQKYGVITVDSLQELIYTAQAVCILIKAGKMPQTRKVASINISGAENVLCADMGERAGVIHADLADQTKARLKQLLPSFATPANPLDATTHFFDKIPEMVELLRIMSSDPEVGAITIGVEVDSNPTPKDMSEIQAITTAAKDGGIKPMFAMCSLEATRSLEIRRQLEYVGVPILGPATIGYKILGNIMAYASRHECIHDLTPVGGGIHGGKVTLTEVESKQLLKQFGIRLPMERLVHSCEDISAAADDFSFPVVLKINSPDITHKSDAGGVKLNLNTADEVQEAYESMMGSCALYDPKAKLDGALLCEMIPPGLEFIIGVNNDPQLGPVILVGLGGVFVELFKDCAMCPAPINLEAAHHMLKSLKSYPLLHSYRNGLEYDEDALAQMIVRVSQLSVAYKDSLWELDINPVIVLPKGSGAVAADALAIVSDRVEK